MIMVGSMKIIETFQNLKIKRLIKKNFTKYILISISATVIELSLFFILNFFLHKLISYEAILLSNIISRILSSLYSYYLSSHFVFKKYSRVVFKKYIYMTIFNMLISTILVYIINKHFIDTYAIYIKMIIDTIVFVFNYLIQKKVVFK